MPKRGMFRPDRLKHNMDAETLARCFKGAYALCAHLEEKARKRRAAKAYKPKRKRAVH